MIYDAISKKQVLDLTEAATTPAISIYIPTSRLGTDVQQGRIKLRNLLEQAEKLLVKQGMRHTLAIDFLAAARELDANMDFWNHRCDSVALFIGPTLLRAFHLPFTTPEFLSVGTSYYVRPLLPVLNQCDSYFALALEKNSVRLLRFEGGKCEQEKVEDLPISYEKYFSLDYSEKQQRTHSAGPLGRAGSVISHGAGDKGTDEKDRLHRFCVAIARAVEHHLADSKQFLVLAGTEEIQDAYRSISKYHYLLPNGIDSSPKMLQAEELGRLASKIVEEHTDKARRAAMEHYREIAGTGLTSQQIEEVVPAAMQGKVDVLFTVPDENIWNTPDGEPLGDELLNSAAIATIQSRGTVYPVDVEDLALTGPVGAIYRY